MLARPTRPFVATALLLLVTTTAAPTLASTDADGAEPTVRAALFDPSSIDPDAADDIGSGHVVRLLYRGLTELDADGRVVGAVAESWDADPEAGRFTFQLRDDVYFHNGRRVTADDFVYSFNRAAAPGTYPDEQPGTSVVPIKGWTEVAEGRAETISGVSAPDDETLIIETDGPYALLPEELIFSRYAPVPEEALDTEEERAAFALNPIGNGPYRMAAPRDDHSIRLARFDRFFGTPGEAAYIDFSLSFADDEEAYEALRDGRLDVAPVPAASLAEARREFDARLVEGDTSTVIYLTYPVNQAPFDVPGVREALSRAIDREGLIGGFLAGQGRPATGIAHPGLADGRDDRCPACTYDPTGAREAFKAAGGVVGNQIRFYHPAGGNIAAFQFIADGWKDVLDLDVEFVGLEPEEFFAREDSGELDGVWVTGFAPGLPTAYQPLSGLMASTSEDNEARYANPEADALLRSVEATSSAGERTELLDELQVIAGRDLPVAPLLYLSFPHVQAAGLSGLRVDFLAYVYHEEVRAD